MGRPAFVPSPEQRLQVSQLTQAKVSIAEIARRLELAEKTLRKHFAVELGISPVNKGETPVPASGEILSPAPPPRSGAAFVPTLEQRELVKILAGARISEDEIARKLGMPVCQLKEHFAEDIENGPATVRADIIQSTYYAAKSGNVAAAKVMLLLNAQAQGDEDEKPKGPSPIPLGKKDQRAADAATAGKGSEWGDDLDAPAAVATKH